MSLYNQLNLESAMDDGASKYMLDGNESKWIKSWMNAQHLFIRLG